MPMSPNDVQLTIAGYTLNLGFRAIAVNEVRDVVPYHEIVLTASADAAGPQTSITIGFWVDPKQFAPTSVGSYDTVAHVIKITAPISEFDRTYRVLRDKRPVFFVFEPANVVDSPHPNIKSVQSASIVTDMEPTGRR
jgi:hypothetical protein